MQFSIGNVQFQGHLGLLRHTPLKHFRHQPSDHSVVPRTLWQQIRLFEIKRINVGNTGAAMAITHVEDDATLATAPAQTTATREQNKLKQNPRGPSTNVTGTIAVQETEMIRTNSSVRHSPSISAGVGFELEIPGCEVEPYLPRGTVLMEGHGWKLETDRIPNQERSDLEFVFSPMSDISEIEVATDEITRLIGKFREKALNHDGTVSFSDFSGCLYPQHRIKVHDVRFGGRLQSTFGVDLKNMTVAINETFSKNEARRIHENADSVGNHFKEIYGEPLTEAAKGFVRLINMYLARAEGGADTGTVHIYFRMMARSDFCSIYDKLLGPTDQKQIKLLLCTNSETKVPPFMKALNLPISAHVFRTAYMDSEYQRKQQGPYTKDWLNSIVHGRGEGRFKKDLMSPPPGYPLHTGNLNVDYGMGAMGVDEEKKLVLFEVRGAPRRPESIPVNNQIKHAIVNEYIEASKYNRALSVDVNIPSSIGRRYELLNSCEKLYGELQRIEKRIDKEDFAKSWKFIKIFIGSAQQSIGKLGTEMINEKNTHWASGLSASLKELSGILQAWNKFTAPLQDAKEVLNFAEKYKKALIQFEQELWIAGNRSD